MWMDLDHRLLEIKFTVIPKTEFSFNGEDFTELHNVDGIIERAMFNRDKQSRFIKSQLSPTDLAALKRLHKFFYVQETQEHLIFTPKLELELEPSPSPSPYQNEDPSSDTPHFGF